MKSHRFRATCTRTGNHVFGSVEAARHLGAALKTRFNWSVDLRNADIDVHLRLLDRYDDARSKQQQQHHHHHHRSNFERPLMPQQLGCTVSIALTESSLFRRDIVSFGPTNLRSTVCHALLRLARTKQSTCMRASTA